MRFSQVLFRQKGYFCYNQSISFTKTRKYSGNAGIRLGERLPGSSKPIKITYDPPISIFLDPDLTGRKAGKTPYIEQKSGNYPSVVVIKTILG